MLPRSLRSFAVVALGGALAAASGCGDSASPAEDTPDAHTPIEEGGAPPIDTPPIGSPTDGQAPTPETCAETSEKAEIAPVDMYVMLDRSTSLETDHRWESIVNAIGNVVYLPQFLGMGMGLQYFPLHQLCNVDAYSNPDVPIDTLPGPAGPTIISSLAENKPWGDSPMAPALQGALEYARQWQLAHPDRVSVVVLATDGLPDHTCQLPTDAGVVNDVDGLVKLAGDALASTPPIRTFVIGVGDAHTELNQIAAAGGTQNAVFVDTLFGVEQQFMDALDSVRGRALSCDYTIPPPTTGTLDLSKVNVRLSPNDGNANQDFLYVEGPADCDKVPSGGAGWYYDDPSDAKRVLLCPNACARAKAATQGQLDVLFGCATRAADIPK